MKKLTITTLLLACFTFTSYSQDTLQNKQDIQKPNVTYTVGSAKVTVWHNEKEGKYGIFTDKNFKVERVYKKDDKWETSNYFDLTELLQLRAAIDKAINEEGVKIKDGSEK